MKTGELRITASTLTEELGWRWPLTLIIATRRGNAIFHGTRWSQENSAEAEFVRRIAFSSGLYSILKEKYGQPKALWITSRILVSIGCREQWENLRSLDVSGRPLMERLKVFYDFMGSRGVGQFVERRIIESSDDRLSYEVRGCLFKRFYDEAGTPELTHFFCDVDHEFFAEAFPGFTFHRGGSRENTEAYGKEHCNFVFDYKSFTETSATP